MILFVFLVYVCLVTNDTEVTRSTVKRDLIERVAVVRASFHSGMCERCHNEKTAANDRQHKKPFARKVKGFDANGNPFDTSDAWHRGGGGLNHENGSGYGPTWESGIYLVSGAQAIDEADDLGFA